MTDLMFRYPHGVLTEQEGGIPNDAGNWSQVQHVCRKHREREEVCRDVTTDDPVVDKVEELLAEVQRLRVLVETLEDRLEAGLSAATWLGGNGGPIIRALVGFDGAYPLLTYGDPGAVVESDVRRGDCA